MFSIISGTIRFYIVMGLVCLGAGPLFLYGWPVSAANACAAARLPLTALGASPKYGTATKACSPVARLPPSVTARVVKRVGRLKPSLSKIITDI